MLVKILGAIDIIIGLVLMFGAGVSLSKNLLIVFAIILICKSMLGLLKDIASWIDFGTGILLLASLALNLWAGIFLVCGLLLFQKGIFSFM